MAKALAQYGMLRQSHRFIRFIVTFVCTGFKQAHVLLAQIHDTAKLLALPHRPGHGHAGHAKGLFNFVQQLQRIAAFAVHLVHKGHDGGVALAAYLNQALGLRLDTIGRVDHHEGAINGGEHAVSVFRKILVTRCVEQIDNRIAIQHLHDTGGDRNAALLFNLHPVAGGVPRRFTRLDAAGDMDCTREQQELFCECGFTRIGVGNNGKSAATPRFSRERHNNSGNQN